MKVYRVWFMQVNQTYIDTKAYTKTDAIGRAKEIWKRENPPELKKVEEL